LTNPTRVNSIKYLKKEEWDKLRGSIDNYRDKMIVTLLYSTGMAVSSTQIHLTWQDNSDDEDYFRVLCPTMWGIQHQTIATLPPDTTSFDHCNLEPMTEYEYYVCVHRGEEHTCSNRAHATTLPE